MTIKLRDLIIAVVLILAIIVGAILILNMDKEPVEPVIEVVPIPTPYTLGDATAKAVQGALGWSLSLDQLHGVDDDDEETPPILTLDLISSGDFDNRYLEIGELTFQADILYAYGISKVGPILVSVVVGIDAPGGFTYIYFDASVPPDPDITREDALAAAREAFPRGRPFTLTFSRYVSLEGIDWGACAEAEQDNRPLLATNCGMAGEYNQQYPTIEKMFINRLVNTDTLGDWTTLGWYLLQTYEADGMPDLIELP